MSVPFIHKRRVSFYETDLMGVMHHSNHVRVFEEARVEWLREKNLLEVQSDNGRVIFAVVDVQVRYLKPLRFDQLVETYVEGKQEGAKIIFRYAIWNEAARAYSATGTTTLVPLDKDLLPVRLESGARELMRQATWSEVWPPVRQQSKTIG